MIFEVPFGTVFPSFSCIFLKLANFGKNAPRLHGSMVFEVLALRFRYPEPLIFRPNFHCFFMFFQNRSRGPFLEGPRPDLYWKIGFWCLFRFSGFSKSDLFGTIFAKKSTLIFLPGDYCPPEKNLFFLNNSNYAAVWPYCFEKSHFFVKVDLFSLLFCFFVPIYSHMFLHLFWIKHQ